MKQIYSSRRIENQDFILAEKIDNYQDACVAQAEYWAEGFCCRKEPVVSEREETYYIWVGPNRKRSVRLLPGDGNIRRSTIHLRKRKAA